VFTTSNFASSATRHCPSQSAPSRHRRPPSLVLHMQLAVSAIPCTAHLPAQVSHACFVRGRGVGPERGGEAARDGAALDDACCCGSEAPGCAVGEGTCAIDDDGCGVVCGPEGQPERLVRSTKKGTKRMWVRRILLHFSAAVPHAARLLVPIEVVVAPSTQEQTLATDLGHQSHGATLAAVFCRAAAFARSQDGSTTTKVAAS
jgi:hypothetical protein